MTKQEVSSFLGVSEKTVGNYAKAGKLSVTYVPGKTSPVAVYDRAQVEALKAAQEPQVVTVDVSNQEKPEVGNVKTENFEVPSSSIPGSELVKIESAQRANLERPGFYVVASEDMERFAERVGQGAEMQELAVKPNLTVKEASRLFGRPEKEIREAIKAGHIKGIKMLRGATGARRADLDEWNMQ